MSVLSDAVQSLENLQNSICSQLDNELTHLIATGQNLEKQTVSISQARDYANAVKNFAQIAGSSDYSTILNIATTLTIALNNANPASYIVPGNPNFVLHPYNPLTTDPLGCQATTPGYYHSCGCHPPPNTGIYWTGILILAGCVGGAFILKKVRG